MIEAFGSIFSQIVSSMEHITIIGDFTLFQFSIGLSLFALGVAVFRSFFGSKGGD